MLSESCLCSKTDWTLYHRIKKTKTHLALRIMKREKKRSKIRWQGLRWPTIWRACLSNGRKRMLNCLSSAKWQHKLKRNLLQILLKTMQQKKLARRSNQMTMMTTLKTARTQVKAKEPRMTILMMTRSLSTSVSSLHKTSTWPSCRLSTITRRHIRTAGNRCLRNSRTACRRQTSHSRRGPCFNSVLWDKRTKSQPRNEQKMGGNFK